MTPPELDSIQSALDALAELQGAFDRYQQACFTKRPPEFFALELAGEAGEVANNEKKLWKGRDIPKDMIDDEAADVFIALMNYSNSRGIALADAVQTKLHTIENARQEREAQGLKY